MSNSTEGKTCHQLTGVAPSAGVFVTAAVACKFSDLFPGDILLSIIYNPGFIIVLLIGGEKDKNPLDLVEKDGEEEADIPLPVGMELTSVCGLDIRAEDIGNALQFLEFCIVFEEILGLKKGEAENVLREILHGGTASPGKVSLTVHFHIQLMTLLKCPSDGENSWFQMLKGLLKASREDSLSMAADYDNLSASEKLRVLNLLCDEVLGTEKVRNWMEKKNNGCLEMVREAKQKARSAKGKEKSLKQKMKDDVKKAIIAKDGAPLSFSEHEAIVSLTKSEAAQAHSEVLESEDLLRKSNETCDALRIEPLFMEHHGNMYWKLNSSKKSYVLQQSVGKGDMLTLDEKWYALDDAGIKMIERHISSR
ncbi:hypothetical protein CDL12_25016 [Handroanthus impetiginosus]|uniref:DDT domain-containing protein n=1 Tax=Handroanthus impetiginosus TaxID=429701 RepID=A0A2G9GBV8_9LAMI|nr:hypothetical protein CDL12_25016 [Handroanthus impetiginosus]